MNDEVYFNPPRTVFDAEPCKLDCEHSDFPNLCKITKENLGIVRQCRYYIDSICRTVGGLPLDENKKQEEARCLLEDVDISNRELKELRASIETLQQMIG